MVLPPDLTFRLMSATMWSLSARIACGSCRNSSNMVGISFSAATTASRPRTSPISDPRITASPENRSRLTSPRLIPSIALRAISIFCWGVSLVPASAILSPASAFEALLQLFRITGNPGLGGLALVVHMEHEGLLISVGLSVSLDGIINERNNMLVVRENVVDVKADVLERLRELGHIPHEGVLALEVAAKLRAPAAVPDGIVGEQFSNRLEIAALERLESVTNFLNLLVEAELNSRFRHVRLL